MINFRPGSRDHIVQSGCLQDFWTTTLLVWASPHHVITWTRLGCRVGQNI